MGLISKLKLAVPWGHIAARAWGSHQAAPVLCLHGWLDNANSFDRLIPLLPKDFYYVAMDFGGHGLSSHYSPGFPYYHQNFVSEVRRVAAALKWNRFSILGHSFGVWLNRDRRITWPEHCFDFVSRELFVHYIKNLQAQVLLIKATEGYYAIRRENDGNREPMMFVSSSLKSVLKERFQYVEVPGNHYIHMNQPQQVAGVISSFLQNKEGTPAPL